MESKLFKQQLQSVTKAGRLLRLPHWEPEVWAEQPEKKQVEAWYECWLECKGDPALWAAIVKDTNQEAKENAK